MASYRDVDIPRFSGASFDSYANRKEKLYRINLDWLANKSLSFNMQLQQEEFTNTAQGPEYLLTRSMPLTMTWHHYSGLSSNISVIYVDQEIDLGSGSSFTQTEEDFVVVNLGVSYHFPQRAGSLSFYIHNLFDQNFLYQDTNFINTEPEPALYVPEQAIFTKLRLNF